MVKTLFAWTLVALSGCVGSIDTGGATPAESPGRPTPSGATAGAPAGQTGAGSGFTGATAAPRGDANAAGPRPLRRLTRVELDNTVRDLLGDRSNPADAFPEDQRNGYGFLDAPGVGDLEAGRLRDAAEALAGGAVSRSFATLAPCPAGTAERACADAFVSSFGRRAFRRPVEPPEKADLLALYDAVRAAPASLDHRTAIQTLLGAMLQDPRFLYHWERGSDRPAVDGGVIRLGPHEVASRLSYFLWQSMPDDALFAAADGGRLATADQVEQQARRLLADPRARGAVTTFYRQLLEAERLPTLQKDPTAYPSFTAALASAMSAETDAFVADAVLGQGRLEALMTSSRSYANATLARLYGVAGVTGNGLQPVALNPAQRFGLLTQGTFLAVNANTYETSPIKRGKVILTRFLCGSAPPPPPDVDTNLGPGAPNQQTREKFEAHEKDPICASCHRVMDPLGFALESYDGIGAFRTTDAGRAVNTRVDYQLGDRSYHFEGARDLVDLLATSDQSRRCATAQWFRFALARGDTAADAASMYDAHAAFAKSGYDLRELMVAVTRARSFLFRSPSPGEVLP